MVELNTRQSRSCNCLVGPLSLLAYPVITHTPLEAGNPYKLCVLAIDIAMANNIYNYCIVFHYDDGARMGEN